VKHKLDDQAVELKDDRSLFARMLIVARLRPEINLYWPARVYLLSTNLVYSKLQ